jgi:3-oxoacyl-[acyl-carrier protein] reductase
VGRLLEEKVVIVTGGGRGLGKTYCLKMAEEGAKVVVADILDREAEEVANKIKAEGGTAIAMKADITSDADTQRMADKTAQEFGRIDVLVNNAGYYFGVARKPLNEISSEEWDQAMLLNAKGTWLCCKAVYPQMKKQGKGKIINTTSEVVFAPTKRMIHYVASKAAVIGITRSLAGELGEFGICVNAIAPGLTDTEASRSWVPNIEKYDVSTIPMGRLGLPEDIVGAVIFFASDYSDYVSGQTLIIDGARRVH